MARSSSAVTSSTWATASTSAGSTPTARPTPASIRARTSTCGPSPCRPMGRSSSAARSRCWAGRHRHDGAPVDRPAQPRRLARHELRSGHERSGLRQRPGGAAGREDPGRRRVHRARRRHRHDGPRNIGRLNPDGSVDSSFDPGANDVVREIALQADGKIVVGGFFTMLGGGGTGTTARQRIGRLNANGSLDTGFDPGANARHPGPGCGPGWDHPGRRRLHDGWRRRVRHHDAQQDCPARCRRLGRYGLRSRREQPRSTPWQCRRMEISWSAATSRCSVGAAPAQLRASGSAGFSSPRLRPPSRPIRRTRP